MGPTVENYNMSSIRISLEINVGSPLPWKLLFQKNDCSGNTIYNLGGKKNFIGDTIIQSENGLHSYT